MSTQLWLLCEERTQTLELSPPPDCESLRWGTTPSKGMAETRLLAKINMQKRCHRDDGDLDDQWEAE